MSSVHTTESRHFIIYGAVKNAPHCLIWTHPEVVNAELVSFLE